MCLALQQGLNGIRGLLWNHYGRETAVGVVRLIEGETPFWRTWTVDQGYGGHDVRGDYHHGDVALQGIGARGASMLRPEVGQ